MQKPVGLVALVEAGGESVVAAVARVEAQRTVLLLSWLPRKLVTWTP